MQMVLQQQQRQRSYDAFRSALVNHPSYVGSGYTVKRVEQFIRDGVRYPHYYVLWEGMERDGGIINVSSRCNSSQFNVYTDQFVFDGDRVRYVHGPYKKEYVVVYGVDASKK